jgi:hypothetical protein
VDIWTCLTGANVLCPPNAISDFSILKHSNINATLVKEDNHDLPDADDDNKEYDQKSKLEFGNYETEEDTEECNSENLPELQLSHSSFVSSEDDLTKSL